MANGPLGKLRPAASCAPCFEIRLFSVDRRGLLVKYYHQFRKNVGDDPTGYGTLKSILGLAEKDMEAFQEKWEAWVLTLRFP